MHKRGVKKERSRSEGERQCGPLPSSRSGLTSSWLSVRAECTPTGDCIHGGAGWAFPAVSLTTGLQHWPTAWEHQLFTVSSSLLHKLPICSVPIYNGFLPEQHDQSLGRSQCSIGYSCTSDPGRAAKTEEATATESLPVTHAWQPCWWWWWWWQRVVEALLSQEC